MRVRLLLAFAVAAAAASPLPGALAAAKRRDANAPPAGARGDLVVTFAGAGGGTYRYHEPAQGAPVACRSPDTTYTETDSYHWSYRFLLAPSGGTSDAPFATAGGGQLSGTEQLAQCGAAAALTSTCTQALAPPGPSSEADLAYPTVSVGAAGRLVTVGALGELATTSAQPSCSGIEVFAPNPLPAFDELQASVSFDRAQLESAGVVRRRFTMGGSGLYAGVALSGSCAGAGCQLRDCAQAAAPAPAAPPASCSFSEDYSGTVEVELVR
jgi:hypothetical protein